MGRENPAAVRLSGSRPLRRDICDGEKSFRPGRKTKPLVTFGKPAGAETALDSWPPSRLAALEMDRAGAGTLPRRPSS